MNHAQVNKKVINQLAKIRSKKEIYTLVIKPEDYLTINKSVCSYLIHNLKLHGIYVSLNNSCRQMSDMFNKERIDTKRLTFIECTGLKEKNKANNCISLHSSQSLTELSLSIFEECKNKKIEFIFFDSISTLLIYNDLETTERFFQHIIQRAKNMALCMVLISIEEEKSNKLLPILSQFCDRVFKIQ